MSFTNLKSGGKDGGSNPCLNKRFQSKDLVSTLRNPLGPKPSRVVAGLKADEKHAKEQKIKGKEKKKKGEGKFLYDARAYHDPEKEKQSEEYRLKRDSYLKSQQNSRNMKKPFIPPHQWYSGDPHIPPWLPQNHHPYNHLPNWGPPPHIYAEGKSSFSRESSPKRSFRDEKMDYDGFDGYFSPSEKLYRDRGYADENYGGGGYGGKKYGSGDKMYDDKYYGEKYYDQKNYAEKKDGGSDCGEKNSHISRRSVSDKNSSGSNRSRSRSFKYKSRSYSGSISTEGSILGKHRSLGEKKAGKDGEKWRGRDDDEGVGYKKSGVGERDYDKVKDVRNCKKDSDNERYDDGDGRRDDDKYDGDKGSDDDMKSGSEDDLSLLEEGRRIQEVIEMTEKLLKGLGNEDRFSKIRRLVGGYLRKTDVRDNLKVFLSRKIRRSCSEVNLFSGVSFQPMYIPLISQDDAVIGEELVNSFSVDEFLKKYRATVKEKIWREEKNKVTKKEVHKRKSAKKNCKEKVLPKRAARKKKRESDDNSNLDDCEYDKPLKIKKSSKSDVNYMGRFRSDYYEKGSKFNKKRINDDDDDDDFNGTNYVNNDVPNDVKDGFDDKRLQKRKNNQVFDSSCIDKETGKRYKNLKIEISNHSHRQNDYARYDNDQKDEYADDYHKKCRYSRQEYYRKDDISRDYSKEDDIPRGYVNEEDSRYYKPKYHNDRYDDNDVKAYKYSEYDHHQPYPYHPKQLPPHPADQQPNHYKHYNQYYGKDYKNQRYHDNDYDINAMREKYQDKTDTPTHTYNQPSKPTFTKEQYISENIIPLLKMPLLKTPLLKTPLLQTPPLIINYSQMNHFRGGNINRLNSSFRGNTRIPTSNISNNSLSGCLVKPIFVAKKPIHDRLGKKLDCL